jgi:2-polyprenyl-3-methyl-5-hydroxy-6-metoxy-1,4-benzoquinol methylase
MTYNSMIEFYKNGDYRAEIEVKRRGKGNFGERRRALRLMTLIANMTHIQPPNRCLDVGCSQGHLLQRVRDWSMDVDTVGYDLFEDPEAVHPVVTDKSEVTGTFDLITCIHTLEHTYDPMAELSWMGGMLEDDGVLVLELPVVRFIMLEHPVTVSLKTIPFLMEHIGIKDYSTLHVPELESCIVFAVK